MSIMDKEHFFFFYLTQNKIRKINEKMLDIPDKYDETKIIMLKDRMIYVFWNWFIVLIGNVR